MSFFQYTSSRGNIFLTQKLFSQGVWSAVLLIGWTGRGSKVRKLSLNYWSKVLTLVPGCNLIPGFTAIAAESQRKPVCIMRPKCMNFHLTFLSVCLSYTILIKHQDTQKKNKKETSSKTKNHCFLRVGVAGIGSYRIQNIVREPQTQKCMNSNQCIIFSNDWTIFQVFPTQTHSYCLSSWVCVCLYVLYPHAHQHFFLKHLYNYTVYNINPVT